MQQGAMDLHIERRSDMAELINENLADEQPTQQGDGAQLMDSQRGAGKSDRSGPGRGWHGDPAGHAAAGRKGGSMSGGNFARNPQRAAEAGRKGGKASGGNFANNPERARLAGRKGGER
jgi:uncharacterized protein